MRRELDLVGKVIDPKYIIQSEFRVKYLDDNIMIFTIEVLNKDACICKLARLARSRTYRKCIENIGSLVQWYDAIKLEMESMLEYKIFKKWDKAILDKQKKVMNSPKGYHRIKVHLVAAVKFYGRHRARLGADDHLTSELLRTSILV